MATSYKKTVIQSFPAEKGKSTPDVDYWSRLEDPIIRKEHGAVTHIDFSPVAPHQYAVTCSAKVQVFSPNTNQPTKNFSRFRDVAYGASFRSDGNLLIAGGEEGQLRMFDVNSKSMLRVFKAHTSAAHVSKFCSDNLRIISGSDDKTMKLWDVASESVISTYDDHQDYVRSGAVCQASKDLVVTGSYDHHAHLYDLRQQKKVLMVDHGSPVEDVLMFPSGSVFFTAGGLVIKAWDALAGGRLLATFGEHHKTVTSLGFCSQHQRIVSASLDRHVKIYDTATYQPVHTLDFPSAILSVAISPDDKLVTVGMVNGLLSIQKRTKEKKTERQKRSERKLEKDKQKASYHYALHNKTYTPSQDDFVVEHKRRELLEKYDKWLKKFEYSRALDAVMDMRFSMRHPDVTVSLMQELIRREGLRSALAGREPKSVKAILRFILRHIHDTKYSSTLMDVTDIVLELYADKVGHWPELDQVLLSMRQEVDMEVDYMRELTQVLGTMETLFAASKVKSFQAPPSTTVAPSLET